MGRIWAICSGSGGVGKSTIALSLAAGAAKAGKHTVLLDASGISRSCDLVLGLESIVVLDMLDVIRDQASMESALYPVKRYDGLRFACASLYDNIPASELSGVILALNSLCDVLVIDLPTGESLAGNGILCSDDERIVVTRPDDASIRAAERLMSHLDGRAGMSLVINRIIQPGRLHRSTQYSTDVVQNTLDRAAIGSIPEDLSIPASAQRSRAAIECDGPARAALSALVKTMLANVN